MVHLKTDAGLGRIAAASDATKLSLTKKFRRGFGLRAVARILYFENRVNENREEAAMFGLFFKDATLDNRDREFARTQKNGAPEILLGRARAGHQNLETRDGTVSARAWGASGRDLTAAVRPVAWCATGHTISYIQRKRQN